MYASDIRISNRVEMVCCLMALLSITRAVVNAPKIVPHPARNVSHFVESKPKGLSSTGLASTSSAAITSSPAINIDQKKKPSQRPGLIGVLGLLSDQAIAFVIQA